MEAEKLKGEYGDEEGGCQGYVEGFGGEEGWVVGVGATV